jgi:hypothetical protein
MEWTGDGLELDNPDNVLFYTVDHVDLNHEIVRRALASALQRSGFVDSLGDAYRALEQHSTQILGFAGTKEGELDLFVCGTDGYTFYGDWLVEYTPVTWVEVGQPWQ